MHVQQHKQQRQHAAGAPPEDSNPAYPPLRGHLSGEEKEDIRYKVLWIGKIAKHKGIGETKVLRNLFVIEIPVSELKWAN